MSERIVGAVHVDRAGHSPAENAKEYPELYAKRRTDDDRGRFSGTCMAMMSLPRYGPNECWGLITEALAKWGIPISRHFGAFWGQCMERGFEQLIERRIDWVICLDHDSLVTEEHISRLFAVAAEFEVDAVAALQPRRQSGTPLCAIVVQEDEKDAKRSVKANQPLRASTAHFGCTLIRTAAVARMPKPWFLPEPDPNGGWNEGKVDEDIRFWRQFNEAGNVLAVDPMNRIGHLEEIASYMDELGRTRFVYVKRWVQTQKARRAERERVRVWEEKLSKAEEPAPEPAEAPA